eukprot:COSAG01_NODE_6084_length_3862_cov_2.626893_3_plen_56_part_00
MAVDVVAAVGCHEISCSCVMDHGGPPPDPMQQNPPATRTAVGSGQLTNSGPRIVP